MKRKKPPSSGRSHRRATKRREPPAQAPAPAPAQGPGGQAPLTVVGVGASAGGLEAFSALLRAMPPDSGAAFVFVLHMAPSHHSLLAEILQRETSMRVTEVKDEPVVEPNCVYVIPPGRSMIIRNGTLSLGAASETPSHRSGVILSGTAAPKVGTPAARRTGAAGKRAARSELAERDDQITRLTQELAATREYLQSVIAQQEATNEELHNRNDELNRANDDLNNVFGSVQMAIVMVRRDLRIRRFTPLAEKVFNLIAADVGRPISDIKLNVDLPNLPELLTEVIDTVTQREQEVRDTEGRWYLLRIRPYRTLDDSIDGAMIALVDVDAVKQNQETLARQAKLLEQAHEPIFLRDIAGNILYWNRGAERLYGFSSEAAAGRSSHELLGEGAERAESIRKLLERQGHWVGELRQRRKDGREIVVESDQLAFHEGDRMLVLEANRDVTERKRLEVTLRRRVDELAAADRNKNQFLAMLAHELRNPLAPLRNAVEILRNPALSDVDSSKAQDLIDRQVTKMSRLVDDLLDAARIMRGHVQLRREPVELQTVVERSVDTSRHMIESRRQVLELSSEAGPLVLDADPVRLEQVFGNLLNNASKYTPEGGTISVSAELRREPDSPLEAVVRVRDDGVGIAPEMLPQVFELFSQADRSLARTQGGLGIGLSLVRSVVELHGGRVTAQSAGLGRGSEFAVYLPILDQRTGLTAGSGAAQRDGDAEAANAGRVLVDDDNTDARAKAAGFDHYLVKPVDADALARALRA